jgi:hypothetical protein
MKLEDVIKYFDEHNDVCINFNKTRPIVATMDFNNKYIEQFPKPKNEQGKLLVFSMTEWKYRLVDVQTIKSLFPLSQVLQNV